MAIINAKFILSAPGIVFFNAKGLMLLRCLNNSSRLFLIGGTRTVQPSFALRLRIPSKHELLWLKTTVAKRINLALIIERLL
jgi:hypothetical protein